MFISLCWCMNEYKFVLRINQYMWVEDIYVGIYWNILGNRKQVASIGKSKEKLARMYEVKDPNDIFVFKFKTHVGGAKSTCLDCFMIMLRL
uniref:Uncharacterized protein n=1 Tax=Lactuca sativa TaxID=4236 RepID=A0A9R1X8I6_LACSA|nr:hypothetical protein LSAT_V11C500268400 [Lactuca sativa]